MKKFLILALVLMLPVVVMCGGTADEILVVAPAGASAISVTKYASTVTSCINSIAIESVPACANGVTIVVTADSNTVATYYANTIAKWQSAGLIGTSATLNQIAKPILYVNKGFGSEQNFCVSAGQNLNMKITADSEVNSFTVRFLIGLD